MLNFKQYEFLLCFILINKLRPVIENFINHDKLHLLKINFI